MLLLVPKTSLFLTPPITCFSTLENIYFICKTLNTFLQIGIGKLEIVPYVQASKKPRKGPGL
jgi:hypothetical protein